MHNIIMVHGTSIIEDVHMQTQVCLTTPYQSGEVMPIQVTSDRLCTYKVHTNTQSIYMYITLLVFIALPRAGVSRVSTLFARYAANSDSDNDNHHQNQKKYDRNSTLKATRTFL